jgi:hypothetical protein
MDNSLIKEALPLLQKNLEVKDIPVHVDREGLIQYLMPIIAQLLNQNFEKLLQVCYRIDLDEKTLKAILFERDPEHLQRDLTTALVDRHLQKAHFRRKYSS